MSVIYHAILTDGLGAVRCHFYHSEDALYTGAATCVTMGDVGFAILVPEGACVDDTFCLMHVHEGFPRSCGILSFGHEDTEVGISVIYVEFPIVIADCRRPHCVAV